MVRKAYSKVVVVILMAVIISLVPQASSAQMQKFAVTGSPQLVSGKPADKSPQFPSPQPPAPAYHYGNPAVNTSSPSLAVSIQLNANTIAVGEIVTFTILVANQGNAAANNLQINLPVPADADALPSARKDFSWNLPSLAAHEQATFVGALRLDSVPVGDALLLQPSASASNVPIPVSGKGGAIVVDRDQKPTTTVNPSNQTTLSSEQSRIKVEMPVGSTDQALTISYSRKPIVDTVVPPTVAGFHAGFGAFYLTALDDKGVAVHHFAHPLKLTVGYTSQQLDALGISAQDLTIYWYDESNKQWVALPTDVDVINQTATTSVDHFSVFQLSDGSSPSAAFIPSLQGFQVGLFSGSTSYGMSVDVPAGPSGIKPDLSLSYNSAATDSGGSQRPLAQAPWVGKGWSLDPGSIALNIQNSPYDTIVGYYTLVLNGQSFDVVRRECARPSTGQTICDNNQPDQWNWDTTNKSFLKVRAVYVGNSDPTQGGRGGSKGGVPYRRYKWQIWDKSGTLYEYSEDVWWGFLNQWSSFECHYGFCTTVDHTDAAMSAYKWMLTNVQDTYGNTIQYRYGRNAAGHTDIVEWKSIASDAGTVQGTVDNDIWLTEVSWGPGADPNQHRFKVAFDSGDRGTDLAYDRTPDKRIGEGPHETRQLNQIRVLSRPDNTNGWQLVKQYNLFYAPQSGGAIPNMKSDSWDCSSTARPCTSWDSRNAVDKLTLWKIEQRANDGLATLPATTLTYGTNPGNTSSPYPNGDWNRLISADNGQGGRVVFTYQNVGDRQANAGQVNATNFINNRRVDTKTIYDRNSLVGTWSYTYTHPILNLRGGENNELPNSATYYYSYKLNQVANLAHAGGKEFRGHSMVIETDPTGAKTEHDFYQGDIADVSGCNRQLNPSNPSDPTTDVCFAPLRDREFLKGMEYRTVAKDSSGNAMSATQHSYAVNFYDMGMDQAAPYAGLWYAWNYENQTVETSYASGLSRSKTTNYYYDPSYQPNGQQYGNLTAKEERDYNNAIVRRTIYKYAAPADLNTTYIVDRPKMEAILDGVEGQGGHYLALTVYGYDSSSTWGSIGTHGSTTLVRKFRNLPTTGTLWTSYSGQTLYGTDTSYGYDLTYGNQTAATSYTAEGQWTGDSATLNANGGTARTTTTGYDLVFNARPMTVTLPTINYGNDGIHPPSVTLVESAGYDPVMGTMTSIKDYNNNVTTAQYDRFGRLLKVAKPGDNINTTPTFSTYYGDFDYQQYGTPVRYQVSRLGSGSNYRPTLQFYDGLGRLIRSKAESGYGPNMTDRKNIVVDKQYDALGRVVNASQPVEVTDGSDHGNYAIPATTFLWTQTSYDALGRTTRVQTPDNNFTWINYYMDSASRGMISSVIDAKSHAVNSYYDTFGRLWRVDEYRGDSTPQNPWSVEATTYYNYNALDLLTTVTDAQNNVTTMTYDSLGRKKTMSDPDMGGWSYGYDANGNLTSQIDAKNQTTTFSYDLLDRLKGKGVGPDGIAYTYDKLGVSNGLGQVGDQSSNGTYYTYYNYDTRGRQSQVDHWVKFRAHNTFQYQYDSSDKVTGITYPTSEQITYGYDYAWRQTSVCSNNNYYICYASNATYTALDQPQDWTFGNGLHQTWSYDPTMKRLSNIHVGTVFNNTYTYDAVGNMTSFSSSVVQDNQSFTYDQRDRLTSWTHNSTTENYQYDVLGNITNKANTAYSYKQNDTQGTNRFPHAATGIGGNTYHYDNNGNMIDDGSYGHNFGWNGFNQMTGVYNTNNNPLEVYAYDADGNRSKRTANNVNTFYQGGLMDYDEPNGQVGTIAESRYYYTLNGQTIAQRTVNSSVNYVTYIHPDHMGSARFTTLQNGSMSAWQEYDPWGKVVNHSNPTLATKLNYTGQRLDDTGFLYYNSRYYNPNTARFLQADSIVPDAAGGGGGKSNLTTDFHETGFVANLNSSNAKGFYFQLSSRDQQQAEDPNGNSDPQALNRYSYVQNNPLKYRDPSGHALYMDYNQAYKLGMVLTDIAAKLSNGASLEGMGAAILAALGLVFPTVALAADAAAGLMAFLSALTGSDANAIGLMGSQLEAMASLNPDGVALAFNLDGTWGILGLDGESPDGSGIYAGAVNLSGNAVKQMQGLIPWAQFNLQCPFAIVNGHARVVSISYFRSHHWGHIFHDDIAGLANDPPPSLPDTGGGQMSP